MTCYNDSDPRAAPATWQAAVLRATGRDACARYARVVAEHVAGVKMRLDEAAAVCLGIYGARERFGRLRRERR